MCKNLESLLIFTNFSTKWGFFWLVSAQNSLLATYLPEKSAAILRSKILGRFPNAVFKKDIFEDLQKQIQVYFEGETVDFQLGGIGFDLDKFPLFSRGVLLGCSGARLR